MLWFAGDRKFEMPQKCHSNDHNWRWSEFFIVNSELVIGTISISSLFTLNIALVAGFIKS